MDNTQRAQLVTALLAAFPNRGSLEQLCALELNERLADITGGITYRDTVLQLVQWAESGEDEGRLTNLVAGAIKTNKGNLLLRQAAIDLSTVGAIRVQILAPAPSPPPVQRVVLPPAPTPPPVAPPPQRPRLEPNERRQLYTLLCGFGRHDMNQISLACTNETLESVAGGTTLKESAANLIQHCESHGLVGVLLRAMLDRAPAVADIRLLRQHLAARGVISVDDGAPADIP